MFPCRFLVKIYLPDNERSIALPLLAAINSPKKSTPVFLDISHLANKLIRGAKPILKFSLLEI